MCVYVYIYIYICIYVIIISSHGLLAGALQPQVSAAQLGDLGWHYLSNASSSVRQVAAPGNYINITATTTTNNNFSNDETNSNINNSIQTRDT